MASANQEWLEFAEYYAYADEEGYDGVHNGGVKGMKEDAPEWAKKRYEKYIERLKEGFM